MSLFDQVSKQHYSSLPPGWRTKRAKYVADVRVSSVDKVSADDEETVLLCNYTDVYYNNRITSDLTFTQATASRKEVEKFTLRAGQVLITKDSEAWNDIGIPALVTEDMPGTLCGYHLGIFTPKSEQLYGGFLAWLCRADALNDQFKLSANGVTRFGLGQYAMKNALVGLPLITVQRRIAVFLDDKTARIDALIDKKRALLERLAEKRQAIITQAVTKGLNPAAPMKNSGIDWLGEIPAHWNVVALNKVTTKITNGYVGPTRDILVGEGVRYLQSLHIKENRITFGEDFFVEIEWSERHRKSVLEEGDVLIVQTGDIGQVTSVTRDYAGCNCHALIICAPERQRLNGHYLAWLFNSDYGQEFLHLVKTGALHPHLNCGHVKFFAVLLPPLDEQERIAAYLGERREKLETVTMGIRDSLQRLTEYRSAIITAAVTGRIDELR